MRVDPGLRAGSNLRGDGMGGANDHYVPCAKCKEPTGHSSGVCFRCRKRVCKHCGLKKAISAYGSEYCGDCKGKFKRLSS
jgi:hypothetical protein